jgi:hypothetical protein
MLRVTLIRENEESVAPKIFFLDQEHSIYDLKQKIAIMFQIPEKCQRLWRHRSMNMLKKHRTAPIEKKDDHDQMLFTYGRADTAIEPLSQSEDTLLSECELSNGDRIFVAYVDELEYILIIVEY